MRISQYLRIKKNEWSYVGSAGNMTTDVRDQLYVLGMKSILVSERTPNV